MYHSRFRALPAGAGGKYTHSTIPVTKRTPVYDTVCERKKRFLQKNLMSSNQLCMIFKDKATTDLNNWLFVNLPLYCIIATIVIVYLIKT